MRSKSKFEGCLIGGAVGDALGYPVEFDWEAGIFAKYGEKGITEYELCGGLALVSDDTQMTLFTAAGLLVGTTRKMTRGIMSSYASYIDFSYIDWLNTQTYKYPYGDSVHSWLMNVQRLYVKRAPGNTCLNALARKKHGSVERRINSSKGCGGIMRVAPIGLYFNDRGMYWKDIDMIGAEAAALTHGHNLGIIPSAALVHIISLISEHDDITVTEAVEDAISAMNELFPESKDLYYFTELMQQSVELSKSDTSDIDAIHILGEGWVAEETLAISAYCAMKHADDFEAAVVAAVNHSGDSDSTGAVTGNILGAYLGIEAIPEKYLTFLELKDVILEIAEDLYNDCRINEYSTRSDDIWSKKYIDMTYKR